MVTETSPELRWIKDNDDIQEPFENDLWNRTNLADQLENYISRRLCCINIQKLSSPQSIQI
ncbi:hypothetical protein APD42_01310 [Acinetobacter nosocomialis]|nr:hypothetical protein APD42_01310 [Acinetobacter nosocomialis]